ncbi:DUF887-domain-containing protein [Xylona heveae TC161]|uniref:DUF887-domain-containing protein n=1 Tax=Xylona heveae (strain CBS 132557 / TC161) TaxID=1328760 RepID=A0A165IR36_XYLHT|nr:DUF887-domain-containing protein [Xylona heveae TC161]KZF25262.1 DUF887-domain-containing protein [Xylona heveae TC161]
MLDPFLPAPPVLSKLVQPLADYLSLPTLPLHVHEVLFAFVLYHVVNTRISPYVSARLFPQIYPNLPPKTRVNWDVHVVSLVQSSFINFMALWVMWNDEERYNMSLTERIFGYTGACGMIQGFAAGYFLWDLMVSLQHVRMFGLGMLAHAICALVVFSFGFRPFVNYYGPTFILYELSSPFLNFHWFFDKLNMTGSRPQLYNGILLLASFFCCRIIWGTYQSGRIFMDMFRAILMRFSGDMHLPLWLAVTYLSSNVVLNSLNYYWFNKMIDAVRKRFQPPKEDKEKQKQKGDVPASVTSGVDAQGHHVLSVEKTETATTRSRRRG